MKTDTKQLIEIVGIFGVIASLIFVGMQLMLDRRVAVGSQYHERMVLGHEYYLRQAENSDFLRSEAKLWDQGFFPAFWNDDIEKYKNERDLSTEDIVRRGLLDRTILLRLNNNYFQYSRGLLEGDVLTGIKLGLKVNMSQSPLFRAVANNFEVGEEGFENLIIEVEQEIAAGL